MCCPNCWLEPDGPIDGNLAQLEAEISSIEMMIQKLTSRRVHLLRKTNTLRPVAKLPSDILIDIFQTTYESTVKTDKPITPFLFGGICKDWRQIAWSSPLLWSTVSIKVSDRPSQVDLLREWLQRAQSSPLAIYLTLDEEGYRGHEPFGAILELLLTRVEYWQTFDCVLPHIYHDMLKHWEFPLLSSLSLRSPYRSFFLTMPLVAPRLVRIELSGYDLSKCNLEAFPLEQLRYFKTQQSFIEIAQALALLRCARALKECYFDTIYVKNSAPSLTVHTELEFLSLSPHPSCLHVLDNLTLPNLRVLTVNDPDRESLYTAISSFVSRSSCHLERLNVLLDFPLHDDMITLLEALPSLTHLYLAFSLNSSGREPVGLSDKLISRLRPSQHESCLLPRLASFEYQGPLCNHRLLVDMLAERWHHVPESEVGQMSRLTGAKIVEVGKSEDLPQDVHADMDILVSEGMQLVYKHVRAT